MQIPKARTACYADVMQALENGPWPEGICRRERRSRRSLPESFPIHAPARVSCGRKAIPAFLNENSGQQTPRRWGWGIPRKNVLLPGRFVHTRKDEGFQASKMPVECGRPSEITSRIRNERVLGTAKVGKRTLANPSRPLQRTKVLLLSEGLNSLRLLPPLQSQPSNQRA